MPAAVCRNYKVITRYNACALYRAKQREITERSKIMKRTDNGIDTNNLAINTNTLMKILNCGRYTAVKIGDNAGARVSIGKRVLWNMKKIQKYLDDIAE